MKRGLIAWDRVELPEAVFAARVERIRTRLTRSGLPGLVVFSDPWRSNPGRHLTNFMPYWGRSLLVVPASGAPVLVCGLSSRVYPWLRTVTTLEDIRPAQQLGQRLSQVVADRGWSNVGVLDLPRLPQDIHRELTNGGLRVTDVSPELLGRWIDDSEIALRRLAAEMARRILDTTIANTIDRTDHQLAANLERVFRLEGAEDVIVWIGDGASMPRPPSGRPLGDRFCVTVASERRGHWAMLSRVKDPRASPAEVRARFERVIGNTASEAPERLVIHDLSGSDSFRAIDPRLPLRSGSVLALHVEHAEGSRLFHGDTCVATGPATVTLL